MMLHPKPAKVRSTALRSSARGQSCTVRLPGVCRHDTATVVLAHLPGHGKGIGTKESDMHAAYACHACHDVMDGRALSPLRSAIILDAMLRGLSETQARMVAAGLISVLP